MSKKHIGSSLSSFLDEMNIREETELLAMSHPVFAHPAVRTGAAAESALESS